MRRFWTWYDKLNEPWRMLLALLLGAVGIGAISFGTQTHYPFLSPFLAFGGVLFLFVLLWSRIRFLREKAKSEGLKTRGRRL